MSWQIRSTRPFLIMPEALHVLGKPINMIAEPSIAKNILWPMVGCDSHLQLKT